MVIISTMASPAGIRWSSDRLQKRLSSWCNARSCFFAQPSRALRLRQSVPQNGGSNNGVYFTDCECSERHLSDIVAGHGEQI